MAAAVITAGENGQGEKSRLEAEYDQLRRKYASLEAAYKQTIRRLERVEASRMYLEQQHATELSAIAGRFREKIRILEMKQLRSGDELEAFKHQLKSDVSRQYQQSLEELAVDSEVQRAAYADICLQHSVLKSEFETSQKLIADREEKSRLKLEIQAREFQAERGALQMRLECLSVELANARSAASENGDGEANSGLLKQLKQQLNEWRQKCDKLEADFDARTNQIERQMENVKEELEEKKHEAETAVHSVQRIREELLDEQRKRQLADERYALSYEEILKLREENESERRQFECEFDAMKAHFAEERTQLQKQSEDCLLKIQDLDRSLSITNEQSSKFESMYHRAQVDMHEMEQKLKRAFEKEREAWRDEKIALETRIRALTCRQQDEQRAGKGKLQELQLSLRRATWEKEKLAEDLARLSSANDKTPVAGTSTSHEADAKEENYTKLTKRLLDQEQKFANLATEFERYRHRQDQFRDVLEIVHSQCQRTTSVENDEDAQLLIDDLKGKVNRLLANQVPVRSHRQAPMSERRVEKTAKTDDTEFAPVT